MKFSTSMTLLDCKSLLRNKHHNKGSYMHVSNEFIDKG